MARAEAGRARFSGSVNGPVPRQPRRTLLSWAQTNSRAAALIRLRRRSLLGASVRWYIGYIGLVFGWGGLLESSGIQRAWSLDILSAPPTAV